MNIQIKNSGIWAIVWVLIFIFIALVDIEDSLVHLHSMEYNLGNSDNYSKSKKVISAVKIYWLYLRRPIN